MQSQTKQILNDKNFQNIIDFARLIQENKTNIKFENSAKNTSIENISNNIALSFIGTHIIMKHFDNNGKFFKIYLYPSLENNFDFYLNDNTSISFESRCINNFIYNSKFNFYLKSGCKVNFLKSSWDLSSSFMTIYQSNDTVYNITRTILPAIIKHLNPCRSIIYYDRLLLNMQSPVLKGDLIFIPLIPSSKIHFEKFIVENANLTFNSNISYEFTSLTLTNSTIDFKESNIICKDQLSIDSKSALKCHNLQSSRISISPQQDHVFLELYDIKVKKKLLIT